MDAGQEMADTGYQQTEKEQDGIKVVLEFPFHIKMEDAVKQEVKSILMSVLQEQKRSPAI